MRVTRAGAGALLIDCEDQEQVFQLYGRLREDPRLAEVVPGDRTLMVISDHAEALSDAALVQPVRAGAEPPARAAEPVVVEVRYNGPDLAEAAELAGKSVQDLVAAHTGSPWTAQFLGFCPGFAYLVNPDAGLAVPRRTSPRARIPMGAVAVGAQYSAVYPMATPGGWQLIGTTDAPMWDPERDPPSLLSPGCLVRFVAV
ncbi:MAG: 5-oxoprolinase subunit B family protein [Segniliparus sp.]|uniref:5-oxoprolinase subunit B family protein n=1 Tax=Segniliparus sp. TaxID=2804064 RepID=UPI003F2A277D